VDLQNKSPEFVELYAKANPIPNARAKVPLLQVGGDTFLTESMIVTEYVAELHRSPLLPSGAEDRARMRLFIELCGSNFSYFTMLKASADKGAFEEALGTFKDGLVDTDAFLRSTHPDGPFLLGDQFSLAECNVAPFVQRGCTVLPAFTGKNGSQKVDPVQLCEDMGLERMGRWIKAVRDRPSVMKTGVPSEVTIENTAKMLERMAAMKK